MMKLPKTIYVVSLALALMAAGALFDHDASRPSSVTLPVIPR
jgi:hypothetical protein